MKMEWQQIETAPKDGTRILVFTTTEGDERLTQYLLDVGEPDRLPLEYVQIASWCCEEMVWEKQIIGNPVLWMPLPQPPAGAA